MILVYNPTCEMAVRAATVNYHPPQRLMFFEQRMASLMMFLATKNDAVVAEKPSDAILDFWQRKGLDIPQFITHSEAKQRVLQGQELKPWGLSKEVLYRFGGRALSDTFTDEHRLLLSRISSVNLDKALEQQQLPFWCSQNSRPQLITSADELQQLVFNSNSCVLKNLWSASGRGVTIIDKEEYKKPTFKRYEDSLRIDGAVVYEPLLNRLVDFALLFDIKENGEVVYLGKNFYRSDKSGRFGVELIGQNPLFEYEKNGQLPSDWEQIVSVAIIKAIETLNWSKIYTGPVGIDSMLYENSRGEVKSRICIEANLRHTMGNVNMAISHIVGNGKVAEWGLDDIFNHDFLISNF